MNRKIIISRSFYMLGCFILILINALTVYAESPPSYPIPALSGDYRSDIIAVAESQIGYIESSEGESIYAEWVGTPGSAWCSEFVAWCADRANIPKTIVPIGRSSNQFRKFYSERNLYFILDNGQNHIPCGCHALSKATISLKDIEPGDILAVETNGNFSDGPDHTALVLSVEGDIINTIEGNSNDAVMKRRRTAAIIHGVCKPPYSMEIKALSDCQITISSTSAIYNGKAQTVTVAIKDGTYTLQEGTDYTVTYSNNTNAGTATVTITGEGSYTGTAAGNFTIQKGTQSLSATKNTYDKAYGNGAFNLGVKRETGDGALAYKTSDKKVADVDKNGKVIIKGTGSATITVSAAASANYNASLELKITVNVSPAKQTVKSLKPAKGRKLTLSWKKDTKAAGYEIWYSTDKKFEKSVKKITVNSNKTISKTLTKLTAGKKYYVRVRAYKTAKVNGKSTKLYGAWSGAKTSKKIKN